jgi:tRNA modification GTPase
VLVDASTGDAVGAADAAILERLPATLARIVVHNKVDLTATPPRAETRSEAERGGSPAWTRRHVYLSAKTGAGLDLLCAEILAVAGVHEEMEGTFLARERHLAALRDAAGHVEAAGFHLGATPPPLELFAEELREAHEALATITGEFTADDLLGEIFSRFCIGK